MLCDSCKKNNATIHVVKIINGVKQELNLCENCAHTENDFGFENGMKFGSPFSFQNVLSGLVDYINQSSQEARPTEATCPNCGTTYAAFKKTGLMGCDNCYKYFSATLMSVIKRVQGNAEHVGKIPVKNCSDIMGKKKLVKLKEDLQKAILMEEYEKAASIRDEIRELQKGEGGI